MAGEGLDSIKQVEERTTMANLMEFKMANKAQKPAKAQAKASTAKKPAAKAKSNKK